MNLSVVSRSLWLGLACLCCVFAGDVKAQMFGIPAPSKAKDSFQEIASLAPESEPIMCWIWNAAGEINKNGNPSEQWFADPEIQKSLGQLKQAIIKLIKANSEQNETLNRLTEDVAWKLASKAGIALLQEVDVDSENVKAMFAVKLGADEASIRSFLKDAMSESGFEPIPNRESLVYAVEDAPFPVMVGIESGHLLFTAGEGQWDAATKQISAKPKLAAWAGSLVDKYPVDRRSLLVYLNIERMLQIIPPETASDPQFQKYAELFDLKGMKSVAMTSGSDAVSNVAMVDFRVRKKGLGAAMDVPPVEMKWLKELPADAVAAAVVRFSPANVMKLINEGVPAEEMDEALAQFSEATGLDLEEDIINHLEGTMSSYQFGTLVGSRQVAIVRIRDEEAFRDSYEQINSMAEMLAAEIDFEFVEQNRKGMQLFGVKTFGTSVFWTVHEGNLYLANNSRAITTHMRKYADGKQTSVLDTELGKKLLSDSKAMKLEGPIVVQHYDWDSIAEPAIPLIKGMFAFIPQEVTDVFDFGADDIPPVESLLGLRPSSTMLFPTDDGYAAMSRYDAPVPFEFSTAVASGVAIGMLLPAVQQVREAARRTQSMNNARQISLALLNYESANGHFPPAYTVDDKGNPMLSWRVAILPYLEGQELYDQFHHDEPWDSEHNLTLLEKMPETFQNPSSPLADGYSCYASPVIDGSILTPGKGTKFAEITDGGSQTILHVEVGDSRRVPWTAPQDLELEDLEDLNFDNGHPDIVIIALSDGSVFSISNASDLEDFIGACKKSDGVLASELIE